MDGQRAVCKSCSEATRRVFQFCSACQREWPRDASITNSCALPNCALRAALLSPQLIDDLRSSAKGCPYFRACPKCKALLTHNGDGCPKIKCGKCSNMFCFRCLRQLCFRIDDLVILGLHPEFSLFQEQHISLCRVVSNTEILADLGL